MNNFYNLLLSKEARFVRKYLIKTRGTVNNNCYEGAKILALRLQRYGFSCKVATGYVKDSKGNQFGHYFVLWRKLVIDPTGSQFSKIIGKPLPDIILQPLSSLIWFGIRFLTDPQANYLSDDDKKVSRGKLLYPKFEKVEAFV